MLLAKIQQTDEKLTITPMKYIGWDTIVATTWASAEAVVYALSITHVSFYGIRLTSSEMYEFISLSTPLAAIAIGVIRSKIRHVFWQWPSRPFVFERSPQPSGRVALQTRDMAYGSLMYQLAFVLPGLTKPDERKILETSVFSFSRMFSHNPFAVTRWETYPTDSLPTNATEYEIVMIANLIHDYLRLQGPRPCKNLFPSLSSTLSKTY